MLCTGMLTDLVERGVDASAGLLVVIDGGKGLRAAVKDVFGDRVLVQRCRLHYAALRIMPTNRRPGAQMAA